LHCGELAPGREKKCDRVSFRNKVSAPADIGVRRVKIGDRIAGCFHPRWFGGPIEPDYLTDRLGANLDGMLAEYAVLSEEALAEPPLL
jgi:NADPH:quinone reductase-like Zn-dependent oxidoreductase